MGDKTKYWWSENIETGYNNLFSLMLIHQLLSQDLVFEKPVWTDDCVGQEEPDLITNGNARLGPYIDGARVVEIDFWRFSQNQHYTVRVCCFGTDVRTYLKRKLLSIPPTHNIYQRGLKKISLVSRITVLKFSFFAPDLMRVSLENTLTTFWNHIKSRQRK